MTETQHEKVREEFRRARSYAAEYSGSTPISHLFNTRLNRVAELLGDLEDGKVLDVGCGPSMIAEKISRGEVEYTGLDLSPHMIRECVEHYRDKDRFRFFLGSMENLPFQDASFDVVLCLGALEYVPDGSSALDEIERVLKPSGIFIVSMQHGPSLYRMWQRFVFWKFMNLLDRLKNLPEKTASKRNGNEEAASGYFKIYGREELQGLLSNRHLIVEDLLYYNFNVFLPPMDRIFGPLSVRVSRKLERLARSGPRFLATDYIIKASKIPDRPVTG